MHDVIIIGGGPAGLAAALTLGRMRRDTLLIDAGEPRNATSPAMHNVVTHDGTAPAEFRRIALAQLEPYGTVQVKRGRVTAAAGDAGAGFRLDLDNGTTLAARRLLFAGGIRDSLPDVPGLAEHWGMSALHCPYCHGWEVRDSPLAVLVPAAHRVRMAILVTRLSSDVIVCTHGDALEPAARADLERNGVGIRTEPIRRLVADGHFGLRVEFESGAPLFRRAIFVGTTPAPHDDLAPSLGCERFEDGCIRVDELGRTTVPGVYAAGDGARRATVPGPAGSVTAAAAAGTFAGAMINHDLLTVDAGLPDPFAATG